MKRREWTFEKPVGELIEATEHAITYHEERIAFWNGQRSETEDAIRKAGFDIREHPQTGGSRHEVVIDPTLSKRLAECESKLQNHRAKANEYESWLHALASAEGRSFTLDYDDWMFFFGYDES